MERGGQDPNGVDNLPVKYSQSQEILSGCSFGIDVDFSFQ